MATKPNDLRSALRAGLPAAVKRESERVAAGGASFQTYVSAAKLPEGRHLYRKFPEGTTIFDIIPFIAKADFAGETAGTAVRMYTTYVHANVGPRNTSVLCPAMMEDKPCPICEDVDQRKIRGDEWETYKDLRPKERNLCLIIIRDKRTNGKEEVKGVQALEMTSFNLGKPLSEIERNPMTGEFIMYADPDVGKHIAIKRTGTGAANTKYGGHQFIDRVAPITNEELDQSFDPASICTMLSYDEIAKMYLGIPAGDEGCAPAPTTRPELAKVFQSETGTVSTPDEAFAGADDRPEIEEETAPPVAPPAKAAPAKRVLTPAPKAATPAPALECPYASDGGVFGKSFDTWTECQMCDLFDDCATVHDTLTAGA